MSKNKGINIVVDFRFLPQRIDEGILVIFLDDKTKAGDEKTVQIDILSHGQLLTYLFLTADDSTFSTSPRQA